ncbi:leucine-rich repeat-containing protein 63 isoform X2 [Triplophysa dalaica]|uniref:leucine-rich repeat-containing protein 63 isoform X2 n=1 Tax=Triplophysa dalaica TaxID=1582913 RepID=UPI0024E014FA|nr:leucine-rich repeat-containing protein 63 isoform X2 [Triplophysa dalaica]
MINNNQKESAHVMLWRRPRPPPQITRAPQNTEKPRACGFGPTSSGPTTPARITRGFPSHAQRTASTVPHLSRPPPLFCLNDFLQMSQSARSSLTELRNAVLSTCNYKKLLDLFLSELHRGARHEVTNQIVSCEGLTHVKRRIPHTHIICELTAIIQLEARARNCGNTTEVCESVEELWGSPERESDTHTQPPRHTPHQLLNCVTSKHFQGSRRSRSPFRPREECDVISASELALLDCLTRGGLNLSFKAHFISHLPDVTSLAHCLQSLNASFNDLTRVPHEVCDCTRLQVLNLRDNPIEEIPPEINKLHKLHTLIISFCKITHLPKQLYSLVCLQYVDVSYNLIRSLSNDIRNLRCLKYLNVEGNQLAALPAGLLSVSSSVCEVRLTANYTHPLLWTENSRNTPQSLLHTATHTLAQTHTPQHWNSLPDAARRSLHSADTCDCCTGLMYGAGLKLIKCVHHMFGLQFVPIMFYCCSPACHRTHNTHLHHHS